MRRRLYGMKARGSDARGVAVIDDKTPDAELDAMGRAGIRGIRLNLATSGINDPAVGRARFTAALARVTPRNWHIQINTNLAMIAAIKDLVATSPVPVVFDHFGGARAELGVQQPGFADLVELVRSGRAYVKISAAYRSSSAAPDYPDIVPLAKALIAANPRTRPVGHRLAASQPGAAAGRKADRRHAAAADRRRPRVEPAADVGARSGDPENDPGRQSGAALRVLSRRSNTATDRHRLDTDSEVALS